VLKKILRVVEDQHVPSARESGRNPTHVMRAADLFVTSGGFGPIRQDGRRIPLLVSFDIAEPIEEIACGAFVVFTLQDTGFAIPSKMANQPAENIIRNLISPSEMKKFWNAAPLTPSVEYRPDMFSISSFA
jgi:hypothetical protein